MYARARPEYEWPSAGAVVLGARVKRLPPVFAPEGRASEKEGKKKVRTRRRAIVYPSVCTRGSKRRVFKNFFLSARRQRSGGNDNHGMRRTVGFVCVGSTPRFVVNDCPSSLPVVSINDDRFVRADDVASENGSRSERIEIES